MISPSTKQKRERAFEWSVHAKESKKKKIPCSPSFLGQSYTEDLSPRNRNRVRVDSDGSFHDIDERPQGGITPQAGEVACFAFRTNQILCHVYGASSICLCV